MQKGAPARLCQHWLSWKEARNVFRGRYDTCPPVGKVREFYAHNALLAQQGNCRKRSPDRYALDPSCSMPTQTESLWYFTLAMTQGEWCNRNTPTPSLADWKETNVRLRCCGCVDISSIPSTQPQRGEDCLAHHTLPCLSSVVATKRHRQLPQLLQIILERHLVWYFM